MASKWLTVPHSGEKVKRPPISERFPQIVEAKASADMLANLRVALVGCGAVGRAVAHTLALWGIRELLINDRGAYKPASLLVQGISPGVVGQWKAPVVGGECKQISPETDVHVYPGAFEELYPNDFAGVDLVVMALDSPAAELEVGQLCMRLGLPLFQGAVAGEFLLAQVRAWGHYSSDSPCVGCHFTAAERQMADEERTFSCEGFATGGPAVPQRSGRPTMAPAGLCQFTGHLTAMQVLRHAMKIGQPVIDTELTCCAISHKTSVAAMKRRASCEGEHIRWTRVAVDAPIEELTLTKLREAAGLNGGPMAIELGEHIFSGAGFCDSSAAHRADPMQTRRIVRDSMIDPDVTFAQLGAGRVKWAVIQSANGPYFCTSARESA